jgi:biotin transporter BioY
MLAGNVIIYLVGLPWLAVVVGWERTLALGLLPFIPVGVTQLTANPYRQYNDNMKTEASQGERCRK